MIRTRNDTEETAVDAGTAAEDGTTVQCVSDAASLAGLAREWDDLVERAGATPFQTFEWLSLWWNHFGRGRGRALHVVLVRKRGMLIACVPCIELEWRLAGLVMRRELRLMGCGVTNTGSYGVLSRYGPSDYLDAVIDPAHAAEAAEEIIRHFAGVRASFDAFRFDQVPQESPLLDRIARALESAGYHCTLERLDRCPRMPVPDSMERWLAGLSPGIRRRFSQARRAAGTDFSIETVEGPGSLDSVMEDLERLHQRRWNELGFPGLFADPRFGAFQREVAQAFLRKGWLRLKKAVAGGECVAVREVFVLGGCCYDYLSGFDERTPAAKRRPGIAILLALLDDAPREGIAWIDFLRGDESYKSDFTGSARHVWRLTAEGRSGLFRRLANAAGRGGDALRYHAFQEWTLLITQARVRGFPGFLLSYFRFRLGRLRARRAAERHSTALTA